MVRPRGGVSRRRMPSLVALEGNPETAGCISSRRALVDADRSELDRR